VAGNVYCAACHALLTTHGRADLAKRFPTGCPHCCTTNLAGQIKAVADGKAFADSPDCPQGCAHQGR
jgi:hypothetical protein